MTVPVDPSAQPDDRPNRHGPVTLGSELAPERAAAWRELAAQTRATLRHPERVQPRR